MKSKLLILLFCFFLGTIAVAQNTTAKKGTIKVQKKGHLAKVIFDDVNYRLIGIDIYGNIMDTAVIEFKMLVTVKGIAYKTSTVGHNLSREMQELIERRDSRTTLYFKNVKAKDRNGTLINIPDFSYTFPYSRDYE